MQPVVPNETYASIVLNTHRVAPVAGDNGLMLWELAEAKQIARKTTEASGRFTAHPSGNKVLNYTALPAVNWRNIAISPTIRSTAFSRSTLLN